VIRFNNKTSDTRDARIAMKSTQVVRGTVSPEFRSLHRFTASMNSEYDARAGDGTGVFVCGVTSAAHQGR
jgi:hypothetical protein